MEALEEKPLRADAERNRAKILEAAGQVFADRGLEATLDDVAHAAGVGVGTVYRRFADKDELVEALFLDHLEQLMADFNSALEADDAWSALVGLVEHCCANQAHDRGLKQVLYASSHGKRHIAAMRESFIPIVTKLVQKAKEQGSLPASASAVDLPIIMFMVGSVAEYTDSVSEEVWRRYLAMLLRGWRSEESVCCDSKSLSWDELEIAMANYHSH